jgi:cation diffusion facilitator family transporter
MAADESTGTVLLAGVANLAIAVAKLVGGLVSGSSAMLAEAAHSVADTTNQVFLLAALKRSCKPADSTHHFGYGKERYFWSLLAAVGIFVAGGCFSILEGVRAIRSPEQAGSPLVAFVVLGVAFVAEGASWLKALVQMRGEARTSDRTVTEHVRDSADPTTKTVLAEDSAALVGLVLAAGGLALREVTGNPFWDGAASVAIGALLIVVAFVLGRDTKAMLIGESVDDRTQAEIVRRLCELDGIAQVEQLMTMHLGPDEVLVAARVDLAADLDGDAAEHLGEEAEAHLREHVDVVRHVFLDPTRPGTVPDDGPGVPTRGQRS